MRPEREPSGPGELGRAGQAVGRSRRPAGELEATVARLADELEIRNCLARVAQTADAGDLGEYLELFTPDASWEMAPVRRVGHDELRRAAEERRLRGETGPGSATRHLVTTVQVDVEDTGSATATSYWMFLTGTTGEPRIALTGRYQDSFVRTREGWKLARRVVERG